MAGNEALSFFLNQSIHCECGWFIEVEYAPVVAVDGTLGVASSELDYIRGRAVVLAVAMLVRPGSTHRAGAVLVIVIVVQLTVHHFTSQRAPSCEAVRNDEQAHGAHVPLEHVEYFLELVAEILIQPSVEKWIGARG